MSVTNIPGGYQLAQTKEVAIANFTSLISDGSLTATDYNLNMGGMGLITFRNTCADNFLQMYDDTFVAAIASQGTLTVDTQVTADDTMTIGTTDYTFKAGATSVASQGTLTIDTQVTADDTMTIGTTAYTFKAGATYAKAQGTLTIDTQVTADDTMTIGDHTYTFKAGATYAKAQGTLTVDTQVTADDTMVIGNTTYTFKAGATAVAYEIGIGANVAACKLAIVAAINGTDGFASANRYVTAAAFSGDDCVLTAILPGTDANSVATTSDFTTGTNVFDATTLGTTTTGALLDKWEIGIGANEAACKLAIVAAINGTDEVNSGNYYVTAAAFSGDDCVLTWDVVGTDGNAVATTETFTAAGSVFDGTTLGTTTAGALLTSGQIGIGANEAACKLAIVAAVNGTDEVNTAHSLVTMAAFSGDDAVITASTKGTAGDLIATTETFTAAGSVFDAATLGTTTAGAQLDSGQIGIGANVAAAQVAIVAAVNGTDDVNTAHTLVTAADFDSDDCVLTASSAGTGGNSIATTETFTTGTNVFDAATLGTTTAGVAETSTLGLYTLGGGDTLDDVQRELNANFTIIDAVVNA